MSIAFENDPEFHESTKKPGRRRRITLIEVLIALAIVLFLAALLLPASRSARGAARRAQCTNNLKQIALALYNYETANHALPPAYTVDAQGRPLHSWRTLILPYLEQEPLYRTIDLSKPWNDPANAKALATVVAVYHCPGAAGPTNTTTYLAIVGRNRCLDRTRPRPLSEITDPHASTLSVIEASEDHAVPWMAPIDADDLVLLGIGPTTKLHHPGGTNASFIDGRVLFIKTSTPSDVRRSLLSISGNDNKTIIDW